MDETKFAAGQVVTGFSFPVVALYQNNGGAVSYTNGMDLARGVSVDPDIETTGDDNDFNANNRASESAPKRFRRGTLALVVDGVLRAAEQMIMGIPDADISTVTVGESEVEFTDYGDAQKIPYVGVGVIVRSMSNGVEIFRPWVYPKLRFAQFVVPAATEEDDIDWQTTDLEATILRDDTAKHNWQRVGQPLATELEAYNAIRAVLGMSLATELPISGPIPNVPAAANEETEAGT